MPMMKEASGLEVQAKAFAYADYCTISFRVVPISILHQMTTSMSSSPACRIAIGTRVRTQLSTLKMNSSGGPRVVGWHELTKGQGEAARGGQASAAHRTHHALWSCVRGDRFCGVTTSSMGRETPEPLAMRQQAAIVCELRKPLVQDKYSVKAKAQQLMYGFMGLYSIFRQSSEAITWSIIWPRIRRLYLYTRPHAQPRIWPRRGIDTRLHVFPRISRSPQPLSCAGGVPVTMP
jgi:hypothetical protein